MNATTHPLDLATMDPDWTVIAGLLSRPHGSAYFRADDGLLISAFVHQDRMRLRIGVSVDGFMAPGTAYACAKTPADLPAPWSRVLPAGRVYIWGRTRTKSAQRALKAIGINPEEVRYQLKIDWGNPKSLCAHLRTSNPGIRVIHPDDYLDHLRVRRAALAAPERQEEAA